MGVKGPSHGIGYTRWQAFPQGKWITEATCRKWCGEEEETGRLEGGCGLGREQLLSHGRLCNEQAAPRPFPVLPGSASTSLQDYPRTRTPFPLVLGLYLKLTWSSRKNETVG